MSNNYAIVPEMVKRVSSCLRQQARVLGRDGDVIRILEQLFKLVSRTGDFSQSRKMLNRLGRLLFNNPVEIWAPSCPDYTHSNGRYDFRGLNGGVSLLSQKHIAFLNGMAELIPQLSVVILVADHEADDLELCRAVGLETNKFKELVASTVKVTNNIVSDYGWTAVAMTEILPDLVSQERQIMAEIRRNENLQSRINTDMIYRQEMYLRINRFMSAEEMYERTIKTSAQYLALGQAAAKQGKIICNHTTTNLAWYLQTEAAILHNPVDVY